MASTTLEFGEFAPGYFLAWNITSQTYGTGRVTITAGSQIIADVSKLSHSSGLALLGQGSATINSDKVSVTITINETNELKNSKTAGAIMDNAGHKVGYVYDVCIEDGYDDDYNDIYVNLVGWGKRG